MHNSRDQLCRPMGAPLITRLSLASILSRQAASTLGRPADSTAWFQTAFFAAAVWAQEAIGAARRRWTHRRAFSDLSGSGWRGGTPKPSELSGRGRGGGGPPPRGRLIQDVLIQSGLGGEMRPFSGSANAGARSAASGAVRVVRLIDVVQWVAPVGRRR